MTTQIVCSGEACCLSKVINREGFAALRILKAEQPGFREVGVVGLDDVLDRFKGQLPKCIKWDRLGLNTAQYSSAACLVTVGVGILPCDVLTAALNSLKRKKAVAYDKEMPLLSPNDNDGASHARCRMRPARIECLEARVPRCSLVTRAHESPRASLACCR